MVRSHPARSTGTVTEAPSANTYRACGSTCTNRRCSSMRSPSAAYNPAKTSGMVITAGPMSKRYPPACLRFIRPPSAGPASQTTTSRPARRSRSASASPPSPPPIIALSCVGAGAAFPLHSAGPAETPPRVQLRGRQHQFAPWRAAMMRHPASRRSSRRVRRPQPRVTAPPPVAAARTAAPGEPAFPAGLSAGVPWPLPP
jgi:hypothetical protein